MDYSDSFEKFGHVVDQFCYDVEFQLACILKKIKQFQDSYEEEVTDSGREICLQYICKLNNMYTEYLVDQAYMTLGIFPTSQGYHSTPNEIKRKRDILLSRYKHGKDRDSIKMHNEIEKAYDLIQSFKT